MLSDFFNFTTFKIILIITVLISKADSYIANIAKKKGQVERVVFRTILPRFTYSQICRGAMDVYILKIIYEIVGKNE
jgi:hypothetical protein